ncbi:MAG: PP2C family serine/threonine-protein phosphatase [Acidimicrobiales bacterium]
MTRWRHAAATDTGLVRQTNQDALFADDSLAIIADGMGGHAAGEVAAAISIDLIRERFKENPSVEGLIEAIEEANAAVVNDARENPAHFGMGTTIIAVGLTYDVNGVASPTLVHVGDSRAYQLRDGALRQLSEDHSVAEEWVRMGRLTPEEAAVHPRRHQLTRGVGVEDTISIDVTSIHAIPGDRVLLCSDGLSNELDPDTLARLASAPAGLEFAVESLVSAAKAAGGHDNISVILLEFDEVNVASAPIHRTMSSAPPTVEPTRPKSAGRRRRIVTWRVWAATLLFLAVVGGGVAVVHWYAYSTYYLGNDAGTIAVYQGQPSGVLWYQPYVVRYTSYLASQLRPLDQRALASTISEPTATAALRYAKYLHDEWELTQSDSSGTTTTTAPSSSHSTTTTAPK